MKKLLYSGLMALMMLFAVGSVKAEGTLPSTATSDASFFTITPATGSTVAPGTVLTVTAESNWIVYFAYASQEEADAATIYGFASADEYGLYKEPIINKDQCVFLIAAQDEDMAWKYTYVSYTVEAGDIDYPTFYVNGNYITSRRITATDEISISPEDDDENTQIWYTIDGTTPAKNTGTEYTGKFSLTQEGDVVVKAIAVNSSDQTSAVVEAHFFVGEAIKPQVALYDQAMNEMTSTYGKYVEFYAMAMIDEEPAEQVMVYYTLDGTTEPDMEAYYGQTDPEQDGPVYYVSSDPETGSYPKIMLTQNSVTLKVKAYAMMEGADEPVGSDVETYNLTATTVATPALTEAAGEVASGTVVKVQNADDYAMILYTLDGSTIPSYDRMTAADNNVYTYDDENGIVITQTVTVNLIAYTATGQGVARVYAGSDMVTAAYTATGTVDPEPAVTFTFSPASGTVVPANSEITITASDPDVTIWYMMFENEGDARDAEWNFTDPDDVSDNSEWWAFEYSETNKPVITAEKKALKVTWVKGSEGNEEVGEDYGYATYILEDEVPTNPVLTVTPAANGTKGEDDVITFNGMAAFNMSVTARPEHDSLYKIKAELWTKDGFNDYDNGAAITEDWNDVTDTHLEYVDAYNGDYVVIFSLQYYSKLASDYTMVGDGQEIHFTVTNLPAPVPSEDPTLEVKEAGKFTKTVDTVVFDGAAAFDAFVAVPADNNKDNYTIEVTYVDAAKYLAWMSEGVDFEDLNIGSFDVADSVRINFTGIYNGEYVAWFSLKDKTAMAGGVVSDVEIFFNVTNYAEPVPVPDPELTVVVAGKNTMSGETVVFDGTATFKMNLVPAQGDTTTYRIMAELYTKLAFDTMGEYITAYSYNAADTLAEFVGVYNGEYGVHFYAEKVYTLSGKPEEVGEPADFHFNVTNNEAPVYTDPTFEVTVAGKSEMKENTVVFDGPAAFKMKVGEMSEGDSLKIAAVIYTKINYDTFGEPITTNSYEAADEDAEFLGIYNGEYAVRFQLQRYSLMLRDFASITDTVFYFNVTNYEEVIENYEFTVEPVGATKDGENYTFAAAEVAFDIAVKGMTEADKDLVIYANVYTKKQYDTMGEVEPKKVAAAASVRFNDTLADGEYVAEFQLMRTTERGDVATNADVVTIHFTVKAEQSANEAAELAGVNVYPNPNAGAFNVAVPERARIDIFGLNGAKVMSREVNAGVEAFNLDHSGIYFIRVMAGNKTAVKRVVVR